MAGREKEDGKRVVMLISVFNFREIYLVCEIGISHDKIFKRNVEERLINIDLNTKLGLMIWL